MCTHHIVKKHDRGSAVVAIYGPQDVVALLDAQERALCFPDEALAAVATDSWSDRPSLEANAAFLRAVNEALGLEGSCVSANLLEGAEEMGDSLQLPECLTCNDVGDSLQLSEPLTHNDHPEFGLPLSELHEQLRGVDEPGEMQQQHYRAEGAASKEAASIECEDGSRRVPSFPRAASVNSPQASPTAAPPAPRYSPPAVASVEESDLRFVEQVSESVPPCPSNCIAGLMGYRRGVGRSSNGTNSRRRSS